MDNSAAKQTENQTAGTTMRATVYCNVPVLDTISSTSYKIEPFGMMMIHPRIVKNKNESVPMESMARFIPWANILYVEIEEIPVSDSKHSTGASNGPRG